MRRNDVDVISLQVRRKVPGKRRAVRFEDGREVLDVGCFVDLPAKPVGDDAVRNPLRAA